MTAPTMTFLEDILPLLRCPVSGEDVVLRDGRVVARSGGTNYEIDPSGVVKFAETSLSDDAKAQQRHYDKVASAYLANLGYPHTREYMEFLDRTLRHVTADAGLGRVAEICCGKGEPFQLLGERVGTANLRFPKHGGRAATRPRNRAGSSWPRATRRRRWCWTTGVAAASRSQ